MAGKDRPADNPLRGRPVTYLPRMFRFTEEERLRAAAGPPAWVLRRRRLERLLEQEEARLEVAWSRSSPQRWEEEARAWDLTSLNKARADFNRYYPLERDLPMDPRSRWYMDGGERWEPLEPITAAWITERFPPHGAGGGRSGTR